jgi:hypothetical protein
MSDFKKFVRRSLSSLGVEVRRAGHDWTDPTQFIPLEQTLAAASAAGLSVGDYIDSVMNGIPGATQATIDGMRNLGVFSGTIETVVEIAPRSGRYLEKTLAACQPQSYEAYETAEAWAGYLRRTYPSVVVHSTDGTTLSETPDYSTDLVQAHKVFSGIHLMTTLSYFREMARVIRPGGYAVFDIVTETGMTPDVIERWIDTGYETGPYPACAPLSAVVGYFAARGFEFTGSRSIPMGPGTTELLVFKRLR